jgi:hypothetical protein
MQAQANSAMINSQKGYRVLISRRRVRLGTVHRSSTILLRDGRIAHQFDVISRVVGVFMKLSTKGRYATRAPMDLGLHGDDRLVLAREVPGRIGVSESYLEQLFMPLRVAGLVIAVRGAWGALPWLDPLRSLR